MNKNRPSTRLARLPLLLMLLVTACAPVVPERPRFFWPPPPGEPKIEYIDFYQANADVKRGTENWFAEAILGKESAKPIFSRPHAVASDSRGRIYVSDLELHKVLILDLTRHLYSTLKEARGVEQVFDLPAGLALDAGGRVYVSDSQKREIHRYGSDEILQLRFGKENLRRPTGLAVDSGRQRLYVVDTGSHQVKVFDTEGVFLKTIGERGTGPGKFNFPTGIDLDRDGNLYVLDAMNARVQVLDPEGNFVRAFGERGTALGAFQVPKAIAVSPSGHVYITDSRQSRVFIFDLEGRFLLAVGGQSAITSGQISPGGMYLPEGIDVDATEAIWIADAFNRLVHRFQYLNDEYLARKPILPGQAAEPELPIK